MYINERDEYTEVYRKGPGFGLFIIWVVTNALGAAAGGSLNNVINEWLPIRGPLGVPIDESIVAANYLLSAGATGLMIGLAQATVLLPYFGIKGLIEWVVATMLGRVVRIGALVILYDIYQGLVFPPGGLGFCGSYFVIGLIEAAGGIIIGSAQAFVLSRRVHHSRWWILGNMSASALALFAVPFSYESPDGHVLGGLIRGAITGIVTGAILIGLLKTPLLDKGWWLRWKNQRPTNKKLDPGVQPSPEALLEKSRQGR